MSDEYDYSRWKNLGGHWCVHRIVSRHYKMGKGPDEPLTQHLIATIATLHRVTVAKILRDLRDWGYVEAIRDTQDKRKRRYVPIYGNADNDAPDADDKPAKPRKTDGVDYRVFAYGSLTEAEILAKARLYAKDTPFSRDQMQREDPGVIDHMRQRGLLPALNSGPNV
jgi:hypothetical protein